MKKTTLFILGVTIATAMLSCTGNKTNEPTSETTDTDDTLAITRLKGDSAVYGLACDGCTDSVIVLLPEDASDPVTYDILRAMRQRKVIGRPKIGDNMAVLLNPENKKEAISVIDIDELKGTWVYKVMPELRKRAPMAGQGIKQPKAPLPDSVLKTLMVPREYGFQLKRNNQAMPIGMTYQNTTSDEETPVVYPTVKRYREWHVYNGQLIFVEAAPPTANGGTRRPAVQDTAEIVFMMKDSLQLRFKDGIQNYYRK